MALPSAFWLPLAGLLIVAPLPASAASSWAYAGGYTLSSSDKCGPVMAPASASCDASHSFTDPYSGETKSGEVQVGADLASGDLFVHAESEGGVPCSSRRRSSDRGHTKLLAGRSPSPPS